MVARDVSVPVDLPLGTLLGGRYETGELLGSGSSASVFAGRDTRLGRPVAVKVLRPELADDEETRAGFEREASAVATLSHPGVVSVHDVGTDEADGSRWTWIAMERVRGLTLHQVLAAAPDGMLPLRDALALAADILRALAHAHRNGVVHRDLSPGNVMVSDDGAVKVLDFGLAAAAGTPSAAADRAAADRAAAKLVRGSVACMSPEQAQGLPVDARSDLYSVGCLLFTLVTGKPPYLADTAEEVARLHVNAHVPKPSDARPGLPTSVDALLHWALAKEPDRRPATAEAMCLQVTRVASGLAAELYGRSRGDDASDGADENGPEGHGPTGTQTIPPVGRYPDRPVTPSALPAAPAGTESGEAPRDRAPDVADVLSTTVIAPVGKHLTEAAADGAPAGRRTAAPRASVPIPQVSRDASMRRSSAGGTAAGAGVPAVDAGGDTPPPSNGPGGSGSSGRGGSSRAAGVLMYLLAAAVVVAVVYLVTDHAATPPPAQEGGADSNMEVTVRVPDVRGMTVDESRAVLPTAAFAEVTERVEPHDTVRAGRIIRTEPSVGSWVDQGAPLLLVVSGGPEADPVVTVPQLDGTTLAEARELLDQAGLMLGELRRADSSRPADTVLGSEPAAGERVEPQVAVTVTVASGEEQVPDLVGQDFGAARAALEDAGFAVDRSVAPPPGEPAQGDGDPAPGTVIAVQPEPGTSLRLGATVTLVVAGEPQAPPPTSTNTPGPDEPSGSPTSEPTATSTPTHPSPSPTGPGVDPTDDATEDPGDDPGGDPDDQPTGGPSIRPRPTEDGAWDPAGAGTSPTPGNRVERER